MNEILVGDQCDIGKYIKSIKGLSSDSASPTDTFLITFKDNILYDDQEIKTAFMKIYIDSVYDKKDNRVFFDLKRKIDGLNYECKVYELIRLIINFNCCPYFVKSITIGEDCGIDQIFRIIRKSGNFDTKILKLMLFRSFFYMLTDMKNRPAINDIKDIPDIDIENYGFELTEKEEKNYIIDYLISQNKYYEVLFNWKKTDFRFIINDKVEGEKLNNWKKFYNNYSKKDSVSESQFLLMVFFQISITLYTLSLFRMNHNDLHPGNIYISEEKEREIIYRIEDKVYIYKDLGIKVRIYDFDFSFCELLGNNQKLLLYCDTDYAFCNKFIPNKDIIKLYLGGWSSGLIDYIDKEQNKLFSSILSKDEKYIELLENNNFSIVEKNMIFITDSINVIKRTAGKLGIIVKDYDKKISYDYNINNEKVAKIVKYFPGVLLPFIKKRLGSTAIKAYLNLRKDYRSGKVTKEEIPEIQQKIFNRSIDKNERRDTLNDLKNIIEGKQSEKSSIHEEELLQITS
jgi:hypothetical protein